MSHARRLSLSYQRSPLWDAVTKLARPSKCQTFLCKNGELTHRFFSHARHALPSWQYTPLLKDKNLCIFQ